MKKRVFARTLPVTIAFIGLIVFLAVFRKLDYPLSNNIPLLWKDQLNSVFLFITSIGNMQTMIVLTILLSSLLYVLHQRKKAIFALVMMVLVAAIDFGMKVLIQRSRPLESLLVLNDYSFPSMHSSASFIFFSLIILFFSGNIKNKTLKFLFIAVNSLLILLIGVSRIYLNVHWLTDVLDGFLLGAYLLFVSLKYVEKKGIKL